MTPGMLYCQMIERELEADKLLPIVFLRMDMNGDGVISLEEWRQGYTRFIKNAGVRLKASSLGVGSSLPKSSSTDEMQAFEARAEALLAPKIAQLKFAFNLFDRDNSGMVRVPHLTGFGRVLGAQAGQAGHSMGPEPSLLVKQLDRQGKGGIAFNDFRHILARHEAAFGDDGAGAKKGKKGKKGKGKKWRKVTAITTAALAETVLF
jgi:Ca2+-binding EF-hand superfamily protein